MSHPPGYAKWDLVYVRPDDPTGKEYLLSIWTKTKDDAHAVADELARRRDDLRSGKYVLADIRPGTVIISIPAALKVFGETKRTK